MKDEDRSREQLLGELENLRGRVAQLERAEEAKLGAADKVGRESEERFRSLFDNMLEGFAHCKMIFEGGKPIDFVYLSVNSAFERLTGLQNVGGKKVTEVIPGIKASNPELFEIYGRVALTGDPEKFETYIDSLGIWFSISVYSTEREHFVAVFDNITDRKRTEETLRESEEKYRLVVDNVHEAILVVQDKKLQFANTAAIDSLSYSAEELLSTPLAEFIHPDDRGLVLGRYLARMKGEDVPSRYSFRMLCKDGTERWVEIESSLISWEARPAALVFLVDITERVRMEEALKESEERYRTLVEQSFDGVFFYKGPKIVFANRRLHEMFGYAQGQLEGIDHLLLCHPDHRKFVRERILARLRGEEVVSRYEIVFQRKDGSTFEGQINAKMVKIRGEAGIQVWVRDLSEQRSAEKVQRRLATAVEQAAEAIVITDLKGNIEYVNPAFTRVTGYAEEEVMGEKPSLLRFGDVGPEFYEEVKQIFFRGESWAGRLSKKRKDGTPYEEDVTVSPVRDQSGRIVNVVIVKRDVTNEVRLQKQLLHAQKMEAVGTLAGGIAHDFNNLLQVTLGYSELLLTSKDEEDPEYEDLSRILQAAKSGAELVQRLLTFSRKVEPRAVLLNLNKHIVQVQKLLRRTLPKMIDIQTDLSGDLAEINADPIQMEQVLMNLAVNASDAMPNRGKLILETKNVTLDEEYCRTNVATHPGEYVLLRVSDTGQGMEKKTIEHIFEPFYTTKELGRGTGLGLAMVYGIVKQHGGFITCYSEVGRGTAFSAFFPAMGKPTDSEVKKIGEIPASGTETILLVDDEPPVRELGERILAKAGYTVLVAGNGIEARDLFIGNGKQIALVILDLVMPDMGGQECLCELLKIDPRAKILVASGYSPDDGMRGILELGARGFVHKPFRFKELLQQVREVLDEM